MVENSSLKLIITLLLLSTSFSLSSSPSEENASEKIMDLLENVETLQKKIISENKNNTDDPNLTLTTKKHKSSRRLKMIRRKKRALQKELAMLKNRYRVLRMQNRKYGGRRNHTRRKHSRRTSIENEIAAEHRQKMEAHRIEIARLKERIRRLQEEVDLDGGEPENFEIGGESKSESEESSEEEPDIIDKFMPTTFDKIAAGLGVGALGTGIGAGAYKKNHLHKQKALMEEKFSQDNLYITLYQNDIDKLKAITLGLSSCGSRIESTRNNLVYRLNSKINHLYY